MSKSNNNVQVNAKENTTKPTAQRTKKTENAVKVPADLIGVISTIATGETSNFTAIYGNLTGTANEAIHALEGMNTNGKNPKQDEEIRAGILQVYFDTSEKGAEAVKHIVESQDKSHQLIIIVIFLLSLGGCSYFAESLYNKNSNAANWMSTLSNILSTKRLPK